MLGDRDIMRAMVDGWLTVDPLDWQRLQPASIDVTLGAEFAVPPEDTHPELLDVPLDPRSPDISSMVLHEASDDEPFVLGGWSFALGHTFETVTVTPELAAVLDGKSSIARWGLMVHVTAGYADPGWDGQLTLELFNLRRRAIELRPGMPIGQLRFFELKTPCARPYGSAALRSKYDGRGVQPSLYHRNFEGDQP